MTHSLPSFRPLGPQKPSQELDTEVCVLYPGNEDRLEAFRDEYVRNWNRQGIPDQLMLSYDPGYQLVKRLDIGPPDNDMAKPTTLIVDKEGVVQYAYVGTDEADRPTATLLLDKLKAIR